VISKTTYLRGLKVVAACAAVVGAPVAAAVVTARPTQDALPSAVTAEALSQILVPAAMQTEGSFAPDLPEPDRKAKHVDVIEATIASSGATPDVALEALGLTLSTMTADGALTPALKAAIEDVMARIRAFLKLDDAPSSVGGEAGDAAFGAPPATGSAGGGSDYRAA